MTNHARATTTTIRNRLEQVEHFVRLLVVVLVVVVEGALAGQANNEAQTQFPWVTRYTVHTINFRLKTLARTTWVLSWIVSASFSSGGDGDCRGSAGGGNRGFRFRGGEMVNDEVNDEVNGAEVMKCYRYSSRSQSCCCYRCSWCSCSRRRRRELNGHGIGDPPPPPNQ